MIVDVGRGGIESKVYRPVYLDVLVTAGFETIVYDANHFHSADLPQRQALA